MEYLYGLYRQGAGVLDVHFVRRVTSRIASLQLVKHICLRQVLLLSATAWAEKMMKE